MAITPAVAATAAVGAIRLVPVGLWLVPAVLLAFVLIDRALAAEANLLARPGGEPAPEDRNALLAVVLTSAFLAFAGAAGAAGIIAPLGTDASSSVSETSLDRARAADAVVAALLGFRLTLLDSPSLRDAAWAAITFAAVAAIGAAAVRAIALPRLDRPALSRSSSTSGASDLRRPQGSAGTGAIAEGRAPSSSSGSWWPAGTCCRAADAVPVSGLIVPDEAERTVALVRRVPGDAVVAADLQLGTRGRSGGLKPTSHLDVLVVSGAAVHAGREAGAHHRASAGLRPRRPDVSIRAPSS